MKLLIRIEKEHESLAKLREKFPDLYENGFNYKTRKQRMKNQIKDRDGYKTPDSYFSSANNSEHESENNIKFLSRDGSLDKLNQIDLTNHEEEKANNLTFNLPGKDSMINIAIINK